MGQIVEMTNCGHGHLYDKNKDKECPFCKIPKPPNATTGIKATVAGVTAKPNPTKILTDAEFSASLMQIPNLLEVSDDEVEHVLLYGEPKTAKTTQAGLLAEFYNILWIDGDKGLTALLNALPPELRQRIRVIKIPDNTLNPILVHTVLKLITGRQVKICIEHGAVDCIICNPKPDAKQIVIALNRLDKTWIVIFDSLTQFVASAMAQTYYKLKPHEIGKDVDDYWRGTGDEVFAYWGGLKNVMDKFGNYTKDLRCQFVTISHETMVKMEDKVTLNISPVAGSDNSSRSYAKYFGSLIHAKKINGQIAFKSSAVASNQIQTGTRSGVILENKTTPALLHLFRPQDAEQLLKGSYTEWYLKEGWKDVKDRTSRPPTPKGILPL